MPAVIAVGDERRDEAVELVGRRHVQEVRDPALPSVPVVPSVFVTVTSFSEPAASAGVVAVIWLKSVTTTLVARRRRS